MSYSIIGIIAILIHLIINRDVLWHSGDNSEVPAHREYRVFILGILVFCLTDVLWGLLNEYHVMAPLYWVTVAYFAAMMAGFLFWTRYVVAYLDDKSVLRKVITWIGVALFFAEIAILAVNFFIPIQFYFDENGEYHAGGARYVTLALQVVLFLITSCYTFVRQGKSDEATKRLRRTVGLFGIAMAALIVFQIFYPLLPLYSIGYLLGSCMLHSFVVEDEKEKNRKTLENMLRRETEQRQELGRAMRKIYTDPLTGVKSKQAYLDDVLELDRRIRDGSAGEFGVAVFDLNNLKDINDNKGHDTGDIYIFTASLLITEFFSRSSVYRIGGDEFAAILKDEDYAERKELLASFDKQAEDNLRSGRAVVSSGMAEFVPGKDKKFRFVFERADRKMYLRKKYLKELYKRDV